MSNLLVSCICLTYNRSPRRQYLLEEAIQSFLLQSHMEKELIIVNDSPAQELVCSQDKVTVINLPRRCRSLGEKFNLGISLSRGDLVALWDDDDISLPNRISKAVESLTRSGSDYYKPLNCWILSSRGLDRATNPVLHNCSLYTRRAFTEQGPYLCSSWATDVYLDQKLRRAKTYATGEASPSEWQYIYRWGVSDFHISSVNGTKEGDPDKAYRLIGSKIPEYGRYVLQPQWLYPYDKLAQEAAASGQSPYPTPDLELWSP